VYMKAVTLRLHDKEHGYYTITLNNVFDYMDQPNILTDYLP